MTAAIRPIETLYGGYRFRSRLEARWAVFFDALGVRWEYEPEGFVTPFGPYLPDFALPEWGAFAECKPYVSRDQIDRVGFMKAQTFAGFSKRGPIIGLIGTPDMITYPAWVPVVDWGDAPPDPRGVRMQWVDLASSASKGALILYAQLSDMCRVDTATYSRMEYGVQHARSARFEHGQSPVVHAWRPPRQTRRNVDDERVRELSARFIRATNKAESDAIMAEIVAIRSQKHRPTP